MTDTRMVRLEQIAAGEIVNTLAIASMFAFEAMGGVPKAFILKVRQIADAAGGDVFEPINAIEAGLAEALRRGEWKHPVQVKIINSTEGTVK